MNKEKNALKAGLFIVASLVAAVIVILLIRGQGTGPTQLRTASFRLSDDVGGLSIGDDVRIGGVKVGTVRDIQFDKLEGGSPRILVTFSMPSAYVLHEDAKLGIQSSVTGPANLNITSLGIGKVLPEGQPIAGAPDPKSVLLASLGSTFPKVDAAIGSFRDTADSANKLVKHLDGQVDPAVAKYDAVADRTTEMMTEIRDMIGDSKTDFRSTVHNLNTASAAFRSRLPALMDKVTGVVDKVDGALTSARASLEDVQKTAANARDITASARSVIVDNHSRLDTMVKSLKTTSDNLKETSVEVRHSPWRLLYKPTPEEMGNLNLYDSARQFADGAGSLSDAAQALRDAMHDPNVDKAQLQKLIEQLDESFKNFHAAEDKLWTAVKQ
ncbi:MAG TPA: MlaD family protein [Tepidisphaeraceae bacterium]|jgi:phospholipid/cholesterol/gamma-HCH transport system substrate-binding protein|nr:MlaD family protein [Tepidisphaeraceae bacterium]